ncbi:MAG: 16S rRNA (adenine(1518)-N(6)/adenine(1519)-N(6))-dimethyltransferase RsmA [Elusimicrobiota bacterium]
MRQPFGQNFLIDKNIARGIVDSAELSSSDTALEIGPGKGILTELIAALAAKVIAVELDRNLAAALQKKFASRGNVEIINQDFLSLSLTPYPLPLTIISNLPYNAATPIIEMFLPHKNWRTAIVMVQKEVGERITAAPGNRDYGVLSIICQYYAVAEFLFTVGPKAFKPSPRVDSAVLRFTNKLPEIPPEGFLKLIKAAFQQRRKTILNSLSAVLKIEKSALAGILNSCRIDPSLRPERLTQKDYLCLTNLLKKYII